MKKLSLNIEDEIHTEFKIICTKLDISMTDKLSQMIKEFIIDYNVK